MIEMEVQWKGKSELVVLKSPTRKIRREYIQWIDKLDNAGEQKFKLLNEFFDWRDTLLLDNIVSAPFTKEDLDSIPLDVLTELSENFESKLMLNRDFRGPSNGRPTQNTAPETQS